jgi:hypothetical protein
VSDREVLTAAERKAHRMAGELYTFIENHVCGNDPLTRADDLAEIRRSVHDIQYRLASQATGRLEPGKFRLMGEVIAEEAAP